MEVYEIQKSTTKVNENTARAFKRKDFCYFEKLSLMLLLQIYQRNRFYTAGNSPCFI